MTWFALALGFAQAQTPTVLHARIVSAAIFKPGLVVVVREASVPAGNGFYSLDEVPSPIDGSFWFGSPDMAEISDVDTTIRTADVSKTFEAKTISEFVFGNVGKHMTIKVPKGNDVETLAGTLIDFQPQSGAMTLKLDSGALRSANVGQIVELDPSGLAASYTRTAKDPELRLQFKVSAPKAAHIRFTTLEQGATWNASYLVDLGADNFSRVEGKVQLGLGGLKFEDTETKLMAGFPVLPSTWKYDLAAGYGSLAQYLTGRQFEFNAVRPRAVDPYDTFAMMVRQAEQILARYLGAFGGYPYGGYNYGGGGVGGGGGDFSGQGYANSQSGQLLPNDTSIFRTESMYTYPLGSLNLEPGDRYSKLLFEQRSPYSVVYHWEGDNGSNPVTEMLRIHNLSKTPWTGGITTINKAGLTLAQTTMPFTAVGQDANLLLGTAPDVEMDKDEQEIKAEPVTDPSRKFIHVRLTNQTRISATNTKDEPITLEVVLNLVGDVTTEGAKIEKLPRRYGDLNTKCRVVWTLQLAAGEQKRITVTNTLLR